MRRQMAHGQTPLIWFCRHLVSFTAMFGILFLPMVAPQAQTSHIDPVPLRNWALSPFRPQIVSPVAGGNQASQTTNVVFVAITRCRLIDTRPEGAGSGKAGPLGPPALVDGQTRVFPIPQSTCGIPSSAAYSLNFTSITPVGQPVGYISAWRTGEPFAGTVVLNATMGGIINNAVHVAAGSDGEFSLCYG